MRFDPSPLNHPPTHVQSNPRAETHAPARFAQPAQFVHLDGGVPPAVPQLHPGPSEEPAAVLVHEQARPAAVAHAAAAAAEPAAVHHGQPPAARLRCSTHTVVLEQHTHT